MAGTLKEFEEQATTGSPSATTTLSTEGQQVVKESVVIIDGKERPLKNYEAELKRKHEEEMERVRQEYEQKLSQVQPQTQTQQTSFIDQIYTMAENEIATTGKAVPIQTIMQVANSISQRNVNEVFNTKEKSGKLIRSFKKSIRSAPDFADIEDDFDELVDQLKPEQTNAPTLEVILNSVRGKRLPDLVKKAREDSKKEAEKDTSILGSPTTTQGGGSKPSTSLTPEQKQELDRMNTETSMEWSEEEYLKELNKKRNRFKESNAKNIPQLLNDRMI